MDVKELIQKLKKLPQDLPIRIINIEDVNTFLNKYMDDDINEWVYEVECSKTGESGFEHCGEVRLLTTE